MPVERTRSSFLDSPPNGEMIKAKPAAASLGTSDKERRRNVTCRQNRCSEEIQ
jgi:hypothetical protein